MNVRHLMIFGMTALAVSFARANTCTWSGGTWSGGTWDAAPAEGDAIVIDNATAGAVFDIDVDSVEIGSLTFKSGGKQCYVTGGEIRISGQNAIVANHAMTISNDVVLAHSAPRFNAVSGRSTYCGDVTLTHATGDFRTYGAGGSTFRGALSIPRDFRPGSGSNWKGGSHLFYGPVTCRHVLVSSSYDNSSYTFCSTSNSWQYCETSYYVRNAVSAAGALPSTAIIRAYASDYYSGGTYSLNGMDQTIDRLSGTTKTLTVAGGTSAMTLTLCATASDSSKALLNGALSLVYAPTNSDYVQTISGGASAMTGTITVSNGTFRVTNGSTFAKATAVYVKDGATFDIGDAANTKALVSLSTIELGANAKFVMSANNTTPLTDNAVTLRLKSSSEFTIPDGATLYLEDVYIDGQRQAGGSISGGTGPFKGTGTVYVREKEVPTVEATWNGGAGADDTALATAANWEGCETPQLSAGGLLAHFANGGSEATVGGSATFKGLAFDGTSSAFALTGGADDLIRLRELGITVAAQHLATNAVTTEVKADQRWAVGSGATLNLNAPVTMGADYAVTNLGPGTVVINSENDFKGPLHFGTSAANHPKLVVNAPTNAFGKASDQPVTIWRSDTPVISLNGTVIERPVYIKGDHDASSSALTCRGTNRLTKALDVTGHFRPNAGGALILEGGATIRNWFMPVSGIFIVRNVNISVAYAYFEAGRFQFECAGNVLTYLELRGSTLDCRCADAFVIHNETQIKGGRILMNGFDQFCNNMTALTGGEVSSTTPAVLSAYVKSDINSTGTRFTGAAGFRLTHGSVTFTQSQASTNATVGVSDGTLAFAEGVTWKGATNVVVSGTGKLVVNTGRTFKDAVFNLSGTGKVEIPDGVELRCMKLVVDGIEVTKGTFGSSESAGDQTYAAHFAGKGVLSVGRQGIVIIVR